MTKITVELNDNGFIKRTKKDKATEGWLDTLTKPTLPDIFLPMVNGYVKGKPVTKDLEVIPISPQKWHDFNDAEKEDFLELVEFTGGNASEYMRSVTNMLPREPGKVNR